MQSKSHDIVIFFNFKFKFRYAPELASMFVRKSKNLPFWTSLLCSNDSNAPAESFFNVLKNNILSGSGCTATANIILKVDRYVNFKLAQKPTSIAKTDEKDDLKEL